MSLLIRIEAEKENLAEIRRFVREAATTLDVEPAVINDVVLAVDEAVANIIVHGYKGQAGIIEIEISRQAETLAIHLRDDTAPFDPTQVPPPDLNVPLEERAPGGLGIYLIRQIMDEVVYRPLPQGGNELLLRKRSVPAGEQKLT